MRIIKTRVGVAVVPQYAAMLESGVENQPRQRLSLLVFFGDAAKWWPRRSFKRSQTPHAIIYFVYIPQPDQSTTFFFFVIYEVSVSSNIEIEYYYNFQCAIR